MRTKVTLVLLFLNVALFFFIFKFERNWNVDPKGTTRRVFGPEAADVRALELTTANHTNEFSLERRQRDQWSLVKPLDWPANWPAVSSILNELQLLESERHFPVADLAKSGMSPKDYGLAPPKAVVAFRSGEGSGSATELKIGDTTSDGKKLYVLSLDGARVHVVSRSLIDSLTRPLDQLRADALLTIPVHEARSLLIINGSDEQSRVAGAPRVRIHRENNRWLFDAPINAAASKLTIDTTINYLNALHAKSFPATPPATLPSAAPTLRVMVEGNARRETLFLGEPVSPTPNAEGAVEYFGQVEGRNAVFTVLVPGLLLETLRGAQVKLREKRLLDFEPRAITALELRAPVAGQPPLTLQRLDATPTAPDGGWQVMRRSEGTQAPQTQAADPDLVQALLGKLSLLNAKNFESDAPTTAELENWGFNRPEREVMLTFAGTGASATPPRRVQFGTDAARNVYARVGAAEDLGTSVYAIDPDILRELILDPIAWRHRLVQELPAAARVVALKLTDLAPPGKILVDATFDAAGKPATAVANAEAVQTLVTQLRRLQAQRFVQAGFTERVAAADDEPWRFQIEAKIQLPGAAPEQASPLTLLVTKRVGGAQQFAGSKELDAIFQLEQPLIDALWLVTEGAKDPGAPKAQP